MIHRCSRYMSQTCSGIGGALFALGEYYSPMRQRLCEITKQVKVDLNLLTLKLTESKSLAKDLVRFAAGVASRASSSEIILRKGGLAERGASSPNLLDWTESPRVGWVGREKCATGECNVCPSSKVMTVVAADNHVQRTAIIVRPVIRRLPISAFAWAVSDA